MTRKREPQPLKCGWCITGHHADCVNTRSPSMRLCDCTCPLGEE